MRRVWGAIIAPGLLSGRALGAGAIALDFKRPVPPDETLIATSRVLTARPSASRPERDYVRSISEATNLSSDLVVTLAHNQIMYPRPQEC